MNPENQLKSIAILWVGGQPDHCQKYEQSFKKVLPDWQISIDDCPHTKEALEKLQAKILAYHLVVVEDQLPGVRGPDFCKELQDREIPLPKILLLREEMQDLEIEALESGVNDCIIKDQRETYLEKMPVVVRRVALNFNHCIIRKRAEKELRETQEKFLDVFRLSPNAIIISTLREGQVVEMNEAAEKEFGLPRENMLGKSLFSLGIIKPEDWKSLENFQREKGSYRNLEMKLYTGTGEEKIGLLSAQTIILGGETCIIQAFNDITLQKKMHEELLRSKNLESIGFLAGGIARDFNTLLTSIMGNISIAKMSLHNTGKIHRALSRAEESSAKAVDLVTRLLTFSEGSEPLNQKNLLANILKNLIDLHFRTARASFRYSFDSSIWPVNGDENQLSQLLHNVLLNAVQAIPDGADGAREGTVTIHAENVSLIQPNEFSLAEGKYVKLSVIDNGIGIPAGNLDKIFDPFYSTKDIYNRNSMGLGLSISQSIIRKHKGAIAVRSAEGGGTTVSMLIPAYIEPG